MGQGTLFNLQLDVKSFFVNIHKSSLFEIIKKEDCSSRCFMAFEKNFGQ